MQHFDVKGMTCGHCERAVRQAIQGQDPGAQVMVNLATGQVTVTSQLNDAQVRALIEQEGFSVTSAGN